MKAITLPCGCRHTETEWTELCAQHWREHIDRHARWAEDYRRTCPDITRIPTADLGAAEGLV